MLERTGSTIIHDLSKRVSWRVCYKRYTMFIIRDDLCSPAIFWWVRVLLIFLVLFSFLFISCLFVSLFLFSLLFICFVSYSPDINPNVSEHFLFPLWFSLTIISDKGLVYKMLNDVVPESLISQPYNNTVCQYFVKYV